ncbi:hypothetical protein [Rhodococcus sp. WMMA185]|uniref:hypothetical protein n=1 Tax=Rhodococcus sp. WMMA185 TaxID=679318 RepID=UPI0018DC2722|nr:hypothetical protein [Rhodococcus sp. WMMA185]
MFRKCVAVAAAVAGAVALGTGTAGAAATTFGEGTYLVGTHIEPGVYQSQWSDGCYWERLSGLSGELDDIIANDFASGRQFVQIYSSDLAFSSDFCGTWTRLADPTPVAPEPYVAPYVAPAAPPPAPPFPPELIVPAIGSAVVGSAVLPTVAQMMVAGSLMP